MNPLLVALVRRHQPGTLLLCCFAAIVAAPLAEEFFFRLLLQGWLESVEGRWRKQFRPLRRLWPGLLPVLLVSALFGAAHFRLAKEPGNVDALLAQYVLIGVAEVLTVAFAVGYIRFRTGATAADLGFIREKLPRDLALGLAAVVLCVPLLFSVQWVAASILPKKDAADPVTLFFFAAVMGIIYFRTHRIVPSIVMHVAFNALNLAAAWYLLK
jgi:membrane protease YdiL (CAAX protease family)